MVLMVGVQKYGEMNVSAIDRVPLRLSNKCGPFRDSAVWGVARLANCPDHAALAVLTPRHAPCKDVRRVCVRIG